MDPQAAPGQGSGELSARESPSAEVSATGWGTRTGSRGARALQSGRSPGKRRGPASARSPAGNGGSEHEDASPGW